MTTINISKSKIKKLGGLVIIPIKEYERLQTSAVPAYYLSGKKAKDLDKLVERGIRDHELGKTIRARSLKEALIKYGRKKDN